MTRKDFLEKYEVHPTNILNYVKKFPQISNNNKIDYQKLDEIIQYRIRIRQKTVEVVKQHPMKEIEFLFESDNNTRPYLFLKAISEKKQQFFVRDNVHEKCLKVLEHFNVDINDI